MAKTQTQTPQTSPAIVVIPATAPQQVVSPQVLASVLKDKGGSSSILAFSARYPMDDKGKMLKTGNPYVGRGIVKIARTQATVNWNSSQDKTEGRGGEFSGKGNHSQVVIVGGKVTPLSVHKADIETTLPEGKDDKIANRVAVIKDGVLICTAPKPRFYLRYEIVRAPGKGERADRQMMSESFYQAPDGTLIADEDIKPFLPKSKPRTDKTDIQTTKLENITELRVDGTVFKII